MSDTGTRAATTVLPGINSVQISASPGELKTIAITALGSGSPSFYDYVQGSGALPQPLFTVPASAAVATVYNLNFPFNNGLWYAGPANSPALTVGWN